MTPLSRWPLTKEQEEKARNLLITELVKINEIENMKSLLCSLLSESEYLMISKRLMAFVLIDEGYSDVEISRILHVTRATSLRFRTTYELAHTKQEKIVEVVNKVKQNDELKGLMKFLIKWVVMSAAGRVPREFDPMSRRFLKFTDQN